MIDFACKKFDINEVIRCGLGLSKTEFNILKVFMSKKTDISTSDISSSLKLDMSTAQRAVKKLHSLGILQRSQINLSPGGYAYTYRMKSRNDVKTRVLELINNWNKKVESEIDKW